MSHSTPATAQRVAQSVILAPTRVAAGQSLRLWLDAGDEVELLDGSATLVPPAAWLAETFYCAPPQALYPGQRARIARSGWACIEAREPTRLRALATATPVRPARARTPVLQLVRLLTGH